MHSAQKARDTTLDDENAAQHVTSVVVTVLCNQSEAFASYLGDDQSRYLFVFSLLSSWIDWLNKDNIQITCNHMRQSKLDSCLSLIEINTKSMINFSNIKCPV